MDFPFDDGSNQTKAKEEEGGRGGKGSVFELAPETLFTSTLYGRSRDAVNKTSPMKSVSRMIRTWTIVSGSEIGVTDDARMFRMDPHETMREKIEIAADLRLFAISYAMSRPDKYIVARSRGSGLDWAGSGFAGRVAG